jgi:parallel beta-helix repeat protein
MTAYPKLRLAVLSAILTFAACFPAEAQFINSCGTTIGAGGIYALTGDLTKCPTFGVRITSDDVVLRLNGHKITGAPGSTGIEVAVTTGSQPVDIGGPGTVSGFTTGIQINSAAGANIQQITASGNTAGFAFIGTGTTTVTHCTAQNNSEGFIVAASARNVSFSANVAQMNLVAGFALLGNATGNSVFSNVAQQNGSGIIVQGQNNTITFNRALGNTQFDLADESGGGTCHNQWSNNIFQSSNQSCIH